MYRVRSGIIDRGDFRPRLLIGCHHDSMIGWCRVNKNQILILVLLVVLVLAIFGVLAYLVFFQGNGADAGATNTPTPASAIVVSTVTPALATTPGSQSAPTSTPAPRVEVVGTGDAKSVAQATLEVTAQKTAEAVDKLDAAMRKMPAGEADLFAESGALRMTMKRIGWLRIGQIWLKLQFTNVSDEYQPIDPGYLTLVGMDGKEYAVEASASDLPGALMAVAIEGSDSVTGDVSFRLPLDVAPSSLIYDDDEQYLELDILNWILSQPATESQ
jgi:hypothetical protein